MSLFACCKSEKKPKPRPGAIKVVEGINRNNVMIVMSETVQNVNVRPLVGVVEDYQVDNNPEEESAQQEEVEDTEMKLGQIMQQRDPLFDSHIQEASREERNNIPQETLFDDVAKLPSLSALPEGDENGEQESQEEEGEEESGYEEDLQEGKKPKKAKKAKKGKKSLEKLRRLAEEEEERTRKMDFLYGEEFGGLADRKTTGKSNRNPRLWQDLGEGGRQKGDAPWRNYEEDALFA